MFEIKGWKIIEYREEWGFVFAVYVREDPLPPPAVQLCLPFGAGTAERPGQAMMARPHSCSLALVTSRPQCPHLGAAEGSQPEA